MTTQAHLQLNRIARGFAYMPEIACTDGGTARVYESSAADGPHVWLAAESANFNPGGAGHTTQVRLHMRMEDALRLSEQLRFITGHHYRRPKHRLSIPDRLVTWVLRYPILSDAVGMLLCFVFGGIVLDYGLGHEEHQITLLGVVLCLMSLMFAVPLGVQLGGTIRRRRFQPPTAPIAGLPMLDEASLAAAGPAYGDRWIRVRKWLTEDLADADDKSADEELDDREG